MKTTIEKAKEMSKSFEARKRDQLYTPRSRFVCLKDGSPEWMEDIIEMVHGSKLPDDTIYRFIMMAVDAIAECESEREIDDRISGIEPAIYTSDLTTWLNESNDHVYYLTEALNEYDVKDGFQALAMAQTLQIREVALDTLSAIEKTEVE